MFKILIINFLKYKFDACADKEDPLDHINELFKNAMPNTKYFDLNFFGNIRNEESLEVTVSTQSKKEFKRSQKRPLEELVVPVEVYLVAFCFHHTSKKAGLWHNYLHI